MATDTSVPQRVETPAVVAEPRVASQARRNTLVDFLESLLVTILLVLFGTTFVVQAFKIPSQSMEPTLLVGDHLLVNKFIFEGNGAWYEKLLPYRTVHRGDIIVFRFPYDDHAHYVKRVIGLPGERLRIIGQQLYINGSPVAEPYAYRDLTAYDSMSENFPPADRFAARGLRPEWAGQIGNYLHDGELVMPPDHYFVMGDNRNSSLDSRYWGFVDRRAIIGRPILVYWSVRATADDYADRSLLGSLRGITRTLLHLPSETRWHRMLRAVH
ncbi:MAG TPA: signal peptidase I [Candidatus Acidoferrales bacterium]|nr:signal peptidase I [Candidatus Acidoferrales bacterium]